MQPTRLAVLAAMAAGLTAVPARSQGLGDQEALVARRTKKLESEFLKKASWFTDYDTARAEAKKAGKLIFAYFTRSYAP